jgi:hypothetical protein
MPLDLSPIQRFIEGEMSDTIELRVVPEGVTDDQFDDVTLEYYPISGDIDTLYDGPAMIVPDNNQPVNDLQGGVPTLLTFYRMRIPLGSPEIPENAEVKVLTSFRDAGMVGRYFLVISGTVTTLAISRTYLLRHKAPLPPGGGMVVA